MKGSNGIASGSTWVRATQNQVSSELAEEAVILHLNSGMYYGLNPVGARIWHLVQQPKTVDEIREILLKEYEVEPDTCDRDLQDLLHNLSAQGLIEVSDEATA